MPHRTAMTITALVCEKNIVHVTRRREAVVVTTRSRDFVSNLQSKRASPRKKHPPVFIVAARTRLIIAIRKQRDAQREKSKFSEHAYTSLSRCIYSV